MLYVRFVSTITCSLFLFAVCWRLCTTCYLCSRKSVTFCFHHFFHSELKSPTTHIIREIYEGQNAHEAFEAELEKALVARINYIIVEPARLGDETARWITVGNCLHKTAVITGLASIVSNPLWPDRLAISAPLCAISVFCTGLYHCSWNCDPCCQYQVRIRLWF